MRFLLAGVVVFAMFGCVEPTTTVYLSGDADCVDAKIYMDNGVLIGEMIKHVYSGPVTALKGSISAGGVDIQSVKSKKSTKALEVDFGIYVPNGQHRITIITVTGKRYVTDVHFTGGEMYGRADSETNTLVID
jgi:hypothetical protein